MPEHTRPGDVLADRYRLTDLLTESRGGRFWRAFDFVLQRDVAVHIIADADERAPLLREAARTSATVLDRRMLRVLDIDEATDRCFVVNEWGSGTSLDILLATAGPLSPAVASWIVAEVAATLAQAHEVGVAHGRLVPENVLIDHDGAVRLIGFAVDAALHGLPPGRTRVDLVDLVGLLYAGLTGKWAGTSTSAVPAAPSTHGHVLRPRQVRAGIPRTLDSLCDHVLNRGGDADVSAAMIDESLRDFLGDAALAAEASLGRMEHSQDTGTVVLPELLDPPVSDPDFAHGDSPAEGPADGPAADDPPAYDPEDRQPADGAPPAIEDLPTQAGMPIFHDDEDEVSWLARRSEPAPPPPPFEPPPPRPLFAPDPTDGEPVRRPRVAAVPEHAGAGYWPWDEGPGATGSGFFPPVTDNDDEEPESPGSNMLRLAAIVGACLLLLIAIVIAFNLGRGKTVLGQTPTDTSTTASTASTSPTTSASAKPTALTGLVAHDFDPQGVPPSENPDTVGNVVDDNPATAWQTLTYTQNLGPGGLKTGVGVTLDLGAAKDVSEVDLTMVGAPTRLQVFVTATAPTQIRGLKPAARSTLTSTRGVITLAPSVSGRFVTIWLTSLPAVSGGFRGEIAEAVVKGD